MNISLNWIGEFVDLSGIDIQNLANKFTLSTAEIEEVVEYGSDINNVVIGRVKSVEKHPKSEKLSIVQVDIGNEVVQSVCGAPNIFAGALIAFAKVGGSVKKIDKVIKTSLLGCESNGICCSALELGIGEDHSGILIIEEDCVPGTDINDIWGIKDTILVIDNKSLTHRPDLWGHYGIAREIAAITGRKLKELELYPEVYNDLDKLNVKVEDAYKCYRYSSIGINNINKKVSPIKMQVRLYYCGMRAISLLVDLTNYIMMELGQPMHAFDMEIVNQITVKSVDKPTKFTTLDDIERELPEDTLMICDGKSEIAIAGVMGGKFSEVSDSTTSILLESANFDGPSIRKSSTKMNLRTEASARFEKSLDPELTTVAIERFVCILKDIDNEANISSCLTDVYSRRYDKVSVTIDKNYIDKYIGQPIPSEQIVKILKSLEFTVENNNDVFVIEVPSFRATKDISIKADIVEEIARVYGYDNISLKSTDVKLEPLAYNEARLTEHKVKELFAEDHGLNEVQSYIWEDDILNEKLGLGKRNGLRVINSPSEHNEILRQYMAQALIYFAEENRKYFDEFGIFEIGSTFPYDLSQKEYGEKKVLGLLLASRKEHEDTLFYKAKGMIDALFNVIHNVNPDYVCIDEKVSEPWINSVKSATIKSDNQDLGYLSILHPLVKEKIDKKLNIVIVELDMTMFYELKGNPVRYEEPSKYPGVSIDINLLVDKNIPYNIVYSDLDSFDGKVAFKCKFVDIYEGKGLMEGKKSLTFNFTIGSKEKTLSSEEIEDFRTSLISYAQSKGYLLR